MMNLWEQAMEQRDAFIEEDNIDSVQSLKDLWEGAFASTVTIESKDSEDILELSMIFSNDNNGDDKYDDLINSLDMLEQEVINELATRIEESFMLKLATQQENTTIQDLEKSCDIINSVLKKNPTSSIIKKLQFKNLANKVMQKSREENVEQQNGDGAKKLSSIIKKLMVERHEVIKEDNIDYSALKNIWEKGSVTQWVKGKGADGASSDDDDSCDSDIDDPSLRMLCRKEEESSSSYSKGKELYSSAINTTSDSISQFSSIRGSIRKVIQKSGNVSNLISMWSKNND